MPPKRKRANDEASQAGDDHQTNTSTNTNRKNKKDKKTNTRNNPPQMPSRRKPASDDANQDEDEDENDNNDTRVGTSTTTTNNNNRTKNEKKTNMRYTKRYAYLKSHVRNVPERTIKSKWSTLPEHVQDKVRDMFRALERPVIVRHQNERKRIEAQAAVQVVVKK